MTGLELLVVAVGAPAGYWLVSFLLKGRTATRPPPDVSEPPTRSDDAAAARPWHEVLGVDPLADADTIRGAYKRQLGQYHPDKVETMGQELKDLAQRKSAEITRAYREAMQLRGMPE